MNDIIDGIIAFSIILVAFGVIATLSEIFEIICNYLERRRDVRRQRHLRRLRRELMPDPNPRTVVRRRGWQVPM